MEKAVPSTVSELFDKLKQMKKNWGYVKRCELADDRTQLNVDLSWTANMGGYPDFYIPLLPDAPGLEEVVDHLLKVMESEVLPLTEKDAEDFFVLIER